MPHTSLQMEEIFTLKRYTHIHTHIYPPEMVYGICRPGFLHCNCQTVNLAKQICINLVKLMHKMLLKSLLIVEKGTFNVLLAQLIEFQALIRV